MKIGIKVKLAIILSTLLFLATFSMGAMLIFHQKASLEAQMLTLARTVTGEFANNSKIPLMQKDSLALNLLIENILKNPGIADAYVLDENMLVEGQKRIQGVGTEHFRDAEKIRGAEGGPPWLLDGPVDVFTLAAPIIFKDTTVGYAVVSFSDRFIKERVRIAVTSAVAVGALAVLLVSLVSIPMTTGLLRPLTRLFKGTREIAHGNFDYRIPEKRTDEIGDLVRSFNMMAAELKKKEVLKGIFNRYVSPSVADEILREPERIRLGGDRRRVTVFFADIRGFTSLSRKLEPELTVEFLNQYFTLATEIVFRFGGTVDKFIGDAVMCVFGSPIDMESHLEQGIKSAVAVRKALACPGVDSGTTPPRLGIGLDSGMVIVGNMGSQVRMEYTAVGDSVNLAAKLADVSAGGELLVTEDVYTVVKDHVEAERLKAVSIKGIDKEVTVYNIKDLKGQWKEEVDEVLATLVAGTGEEMFAS